LNTWMGIPLGSERQGPSSTCEQKKGGEGRKEKEKKLHVGREGRRGPHLTTPLTGKISSKERRGVFQGSVRERVSRSVNWAREGLERLGLVNFLQALMVRSMGAAISRQEQANRGPIMDRREKKGRRIKPKKKDLSYRKPEEKPA